MEDKSIEEERLNSTQTMRWAELYERDMRQQGSPLSVPGTPGTSQIHPSKGVTEYLGCAGTPGTPQLQPCKGEVESQYLLKDWERARLRELPSSCGARKFAPFGVFIGLNHLESYLG